jgi:moderate conductance mechanosensitive channel
MPNLFQPPFTDLHAFYDRHVGPIVVALVVGLVALRVSRLFVRGVVKALMDREAAEGTAGQLTAMEMTRRIATIELLATSVIQFFVVAIVGLWVLQTAAGLDIGPAIAGLGIAGVALGFGAQNLVKDYLNGALILIENQFSKGDVVRIAGVSGTVEDFSLRRTTLRDLDGTVHTVPNGAITVASNLTRIWARINLDVTVAYGTDIDRASEVVDRVGRDLAGEGAWSQVFLEAPRVERVESLGEYGVTLKILGTVRAEDRWNAAGELRKRLLAAFHANGIEIPRPQRVVIAREPDGRAATLPDDLGSATDDSLAAEPVEEEPSG